MSHRPETPKGTATKDAIQILLVGTRTNHALAQDRPDCLPSDTCQIGNRAIDAAAAYVCSCFPNGGVGETLQGVKEWKELIGLLGLEALQDKLCVDVRFVHVAEFVAEVVRCAKLNPILVVFGVAWCSLSDSERAACFPELNEERSKEIRLATVYCSLLHTIAYTVLQEPKGTPDGETTTFVEQLYILFSNQRDKMNRKDYFSFFGKMKETTIDMPMQNKVVPYKSGEKEINRKASGGMLLSINVLEAMVHDTLKGHDDNARCGFEIMLEPNDRKEIKGAGNGPDRECIDKNGRETGIQLYLCPLPTPWSNLYSSWNMCFCTNYRHYPVFFAKLLNPATFGTYHDIEGLYLAPQVITLYVHIQYEIVTCVAAMSKTPPFAEWRSEALTLLWGRVNMEASKQYQGRLGGIVGDNHGKVTEIAYDLKRMSVRPLWETIHGTIKAFRSTRKDSVEVKEDDKDVTDLMEKVKEKASALL